MVGFWNTYAALEAAASFSAASSLDLEASRHGVGGVGWHTRSRGEQTQGGSFRAAIYFGEGLVDLRG